MGHGKRLIFAAAMAYYCFGLVAKRRIRKASATCQHPATTAATAPANLFDSHTAAWSVPVEVSTKGRWSLPTSIRFLGVVFLVSITCVCRSLHDVHVEVHTPVFPSRRHKEFGLTNQQNCSHPHRPRSQTEGPQQQFSQPHRRLP